MKIIISYAILLMLPLSMHAVALGDLMLSVQQRAVIDVARENGVTEVGKEKVISTSLKVNGFYFNNFDKREQATVWVNGKQTNEHNVVGAQLRRVNERDKTVSIALENTKSTISLKAGQTLDLDTGELRDSFEE